MGTAERGWRRGGVAWRRRLILLGLLVLCVVTLDPRVTPASPPAARPIVELPLAGAASETRAEMSGLAWLGEQLVLLPQFPARFPAAGASGAVFTIPRSVLRAAIRARGRGAPITPTALPFEAPGVEDAVEGFQGFEAIAFHGRDVYAVVEADAGHGTHGWLMKGRVRDRPLGLDLDVDGRVRLPSQTDVENLGYEAVVVTTDRVAALYEANGLCNAQPRAELFDLSLSPVTELPTDPLEFRLTDATAPDSEGRFWVTNYRFEGDTWPTGVCRLGKHFGARRPHAATPRVERLVQMELGASGVRVVDGAPLQLRLDDQRGGRNWEGAARMDAGFLLVTDEYPRTILAWVSAGR